MTGSTERLRTQVRAALAAAHISQAEAARQLGVSTKHLSMMLTGRSVLSLDWADRLLGLCGMTLLIGVDRGGNAQAERHTVDSINSDALDQLYAERNMLGREADRLRKDWVDMRARAEQAEAAIDRVRDWIAREPVTARSEFGNGYREALRDITDVLDQAQQPTT